MQSEKKDKRDKIEIPLDYSQMRHVHPVPHLNIPDIVEDECLEPVDDSNYRVFICHGTQPWYNKVCPHCGSIRADNNGYTDNPRLVHDVNVGITQIDIVLYVDRAECKDCGKSYSRQFEGIIPGKQMTSRLLDQIRRDAIRRPFREVGDMFGYSDTTIGSIFDDYMKELESERGPIIAPHALGIDEKHIVNAMRAIFVDLDSGELLEMRPNNGRDDIISTIESMVDYDKNIKVVTMDMSNGYRAYVQECLPNAKIIVDKYHVYQDLYQKVAKSRTKILEEIGARIGAIEDPEEKKRLGAIRDLANKYSYLFKFKVEKLNEKSFRVAAMADLCSTFPEFNHLRLIKEGFELIYDCIKRSDAENTYNEWAMLIPPSGSKQIAEWEAEYGIKADLFADFRAFRTAMRNWHKEVFNYFDISCEYTNAAAEGTNKLIQNINDQGNGYSFERLRGKAINWSKAAPRIFYAFDKKSIPKTRVKETGPIMHERTYGSHPSSFNFDTEYETYYEDVFELKATVESKVYKPFSALDFYQLAIKENPEGYID